MRSLKITRILVGLNLIIFLLPFFNTCSNTPLRKENKKILAGIKNSKELSKEFRNELIQDEKKRFIDRKKGNDSYVKNAYELGIIPFQNPDIKMLKEPFFYFTLCFTFQILLTISMIILFWKNNIRTAQFMTLASITILILSLMIPLFDGILKYIDQIKIGFYVYLLNLIIIYFMIKRIKRKTKMNVL